MGISISDNERSLKKAIRADLPGHAFKRKPLRALFSVPFLFLIVAVNFLLIKAHLPWPVAVLLSILLGNLYASIFFFGHDVAHGSVFRSRRMQDVILFPAFLIFCLSPHFWRSWHNGLHHARTNIDGYDPDNFGTLELFNRSFYTRFIHLFAPGSEHPLSVVFLFMFFTLHAHGVFWRSTKRVSFPHLDKRRAALETLLMITFWFVLTLSVGSLVSCFVVIIPMMTANAVVMSYIVTNHLMRRLVDAQDTLATSMSVSTLKILDKLHFNFSHHVEHHLFPNLSSRYFPVVRKSLLRNGGERYLAPSHLRALLTLYTTPRIYDGRDRLVNPRTEHEMEIEVIEENLGKRKVGLFVKA